VHLNDGSYSTTKIYPVFGLSNSGNEGNNKDKDKHDDSAIGNFYVQFAGNLCAYDMLQRRIGTSRNIVVTPLAYDTDNRVTLDAIARLGPNARGVAVIRPTVTDAELKDAGRWWRAWHSFLACRSAQRADIY